MDLENHVPCGPCRYDDVIKDAKRWCTNCEEGLCEDCKNDHRKSKISRNHKVISIEDYRKIENVSVSQVCEQHGENLEWFCKTHDEVLCMVCVPSKHKACSGVITIRDASTNSRQSTALSDLEKVIEGTLSNVKQCIMNRESASKDIYRQELAIETTILETRIKINGHLDKMQEKLLHDLRSTSHTCKSKFSKIFRNLESKKEMLTNIREQTQYMKQFSSDLQVFLGTRQVTQRILSEAQSIKSEISATKDYELKVVINSLIEKLANEVEDFGQINVSECARKLAFKDPKTDQSQIGIKAPTKNVSDVKLQLIKTFQIQRNAEIRITGCVTLPNGNFLIANCTNENLIIEYSDTGGHIRDIPVSDKPFDITVIDSYRIVLSYASMKFLEIMNSKTFEIEKKIRLQNSCFGISVEMSKLYAINEDSTIQIIDLSKTQLEEILKIESKKAYYITTNRNRIIHTNWDNKSVHCCSLKGKELWQFKNESIALPGGVAVDNDKNVYVAGYYYDNLTIIQHDGEDSKTLLTKSDGLDLPIALYYDKYKRSLLICNLRGKVALYKIV